MVGPRAVFKRPVFPLDLELLQAGRRQGAVCRRHRRARDGEAHGQSGAAAGLPQARKQVGNGCFGIVKGVKVHLEGVWVRGYSLQRFG